MKIIDISPSLNKDMAVWPGEDPFIYQKEVSADLTVGKIATSIHVGSHIDAPVHLQPGGEMVDTLPLDHFVGKCQVLDVHHIQSRSIMIKDVKDEIEASRLLFKTTSFDYRRPFNKEYRAFSIELIEWLADKEIVLLGIDTPSVDLFDDPDLPVHHKLLKQHISILEGLQLLHTTSGIYTLIALPLKISGGDGSPTRAILLKE
jgi:arylformamidase